MEKYETKWEVEREGIKVVRIFEEFAYGSLDEVYKRIRTMDDGTEKSGEDVLNKMIKEIENSRN